MQPYLAMLNAFLHDFSVAMLFASAIISTITLHKLKNENIKKEILHNLGLKFYKITLVSLFFVLVLGGVRTYFYYNYEWLPALGRKQIPTLILKHLVFVVGTIFAVIKQIKLVRGLK